MSEPVLTLSGVSKSFPGVRALHDVSLSLHAGRVTALIGENGAGKSTVVKMLTGIYRPDAGEIRIGGSARHFSSPRDAWAAGIAAIHQETVMFDELSVAENIFMGHMPVGRRAHRGLAADARARSRTPEAHRRADPRHLSAPAACRWRRSISSRSPARCLTRRRWSSWTSRRRRCRRNEIDDLFRIVAQLKAEGRAVVFISHKFDEIFRIADDFVCLRDGEKVGEGPIASVTRARSLSA